MAAPSPGPREVLACSPEAGRRAAAASSSSRRGLLWRLRDKQSRLGLFEISPGHELHGLMCMMQAGLWAATQVAMDHPPTSVFGLVKKLLTQVGCMVKKGPTPTLPASPLLPGAQAGGQAGSAESVTQILLQPLEPFSPFLGTPNLFPNLAWHPSPLFLTTTAPRKVQALLAHLPRYMRHLQRAPALATRTVGVHSLRVAQGKKKYFIIMQSVFYPAGRISERYDIKGCEVSRWVEPAPEGSSVVLVLKDLNFQGKTIDLGSQRSWFLRQMELDTAFLRELNVLDYSLLMAFQGLHEDERGLGSSLVFRMARSVQGTPSPEELRAQNRRLLPDAPNALHILDGPEQRYFLGLVDLATVYGLRKRLEHLWKTLRYPGRTFSTVSPTRYARRLCQWVEAHTE
uniref:Phosphatidylinositol-4-phosphate 5-kinase like 1 n=1 Tax=Loxodonta africana TaxID=9785 RepID=G3SM02_LOXAF